jgi:hypothetical protein
MTDALIITSIILVIGTFMYSEVGTARDKAKQKNCTGNLKIIGLGMQMYYHNDLTLKTPSVLGDLNSKRIHNSAYVMWDIPTQVMTCQAKHKKMVITELEKQNSYFFSEDKN